MPESLDDQDAADTASGGRPGTDSVIAGIQGELDERMAQLKSERARLEDQCDRLEREYAEHQRQIDQIGRELAHLTELYKAVERNHTAYLDGETDPATTGKSLRTVSDASPGALSIDDIVPPDLGAGLDARSKRHPERRAWQDDRDRMQAHLLKRLKWWVFGKKKGRDRL
ncbi:hypothetical protein [Halegenticoccus soli]|uniref:hypothetical protein n=1 Tax=Halegenticoccus soli TaxID=1985678 RepID=UPI000C6DF4D4|nr:hypothetical protein [Halegenticoccus soli]